MPAPVPDVSVLVPLQGEASDTVLSTLDALRRLDHPAYEVIVMGSREDTAVAAFCASVGLRFVTGHRSAPATLDDGVAAMHPASAVSVVVRPAQPVRRDLLATLLDVRPSPPEIRPAAGDDTRGAAPGAAGPSRAKAAAGFAKRAGARAFRRLRLLAPAHRG